MSLLKALRPVVPQNRYAIVIEPMLDNTYRVNIDGVVRRIGSSLDTPPVRGSQVVVGTVSGRETIISLGPGHSITLKEVTIHG